MKHVRILIAYLSMAVFQAGAQDLPRPEYPRPQFERESWMNLNGVWTYAFDFVKSAGCSYTRTTGIWQTVWMEAVDENGLSACQITADPDNKRFVLRPVNTASGGIHVVTDLWTEHNYTQDAEELKKELNPAEKNYSSNSPAKVQHTADSHICWTNMAASAGADKSLKQIPRHGVMAMTQNQKKNSTSDWKL